MLRHFIGGRRSGLLFCTSTGRQLLQSNTLQDSLHLILAELEHVKGGFNIFRRYRITHIKMSEGIRTPSLLVAVNGACEFKNM